MALLSGKATFSIFLFESYTICISTDVRHQVLCIRSKSEHAGWWWELWQSACRHLWDQEEEQSYIVLQDCQQIFFSIIYHFQLILWIYFADTFYYFVMYCPTAWHFIPQCHTLISQQTTDTKTSDSQYNLLYNVGHDLKGPFRLSNFT